MSRVVIGVDLGGTNLRTAIVDSAGEILDRRKEPTHAADGWANVVERLTENIQYRRDAAIKRGFEVCAIGVGAPGAIQGDKGIVVKSPNFPDWNNLPLKQLLEKSFRIPVFVENDANAAALGEQWRGAGLGFRSMIFLTLGTGVGGGIILDNKIWQGADGMAGEIGHMTLIPDGRTCTCGNTGCLEMYASARGIVYTYREELGVSPSSQTITSEQIYKAAEAGEDAAIRTMKTTGRLLGIGIANLINIFNPERVVIGGGVKDAWPLFIEATRGEIRKRAFEIPAKRTDIVPSQLGDDAGIIGASAAALRSLESRQS